MTDKLPFSQADQVGVIVRDMDKAIEHYQSLGIGPFESLNVTSIDRKVYGKPAPDVKNLSRVAQMGQLQFELLQPVSGESIQKEFLEKCGEGINHLGFFVDDLDKEVAKLIAKGFEVISSGKFVGGGGFAYFNTDKVGGVMSELIQWPPR
jgi:4-hydroxyphenylpyruvate dioxygenase-like putative hemolysin